MQSTTSYNSGSVDKINVIEANDTYDNTDDDKHIYWEIELKPLKDIISMEENWSEDLDLIND